MSSITSEQFRNMKKRGRVNANRSTNASGVKFDSDTERWFYEVLTLLGHEFQFQVKYVLIGPTIPKNKKVLLFTDRCAEAVTLTVDFVFEKDGITYIVDTKGDKKRAKVESRLKYDILKHRLAEQGLASKTRLLFVGTSEVLNMCKAAKVSETLFWELFSKVKER